MSDPAKDALHNLDLNRFFRIYRTVHEMLGDRLYIPVEKPLSKKAWVSRYLGHLAELEDDTEDMDVFGIIDKMNLLFKKGKKQLLVYFHPLDSKLRQMDMNYINTLMGEKGAQHLIVIANNATPKVCSVLGILGHNAQLFNEEELVFNVTRHQLVPKHTRMTGEERDHVLESFAKLPDGKIHIDLLPAMFTSDAIAKYYNFRVDDLIRIERPRMDGYFDLSYRVVTHPITEKDKKGS
jgi:DNA-directed RNA polymerase I, II, and III subunit RPABC1